jgi:signal transduction histidine kinase
MSHAQDTASLISFDTSLYEESLTKRAEEAEERRIEAEERRRGQEVSNTLEALWRPLMQKQLLVDVTSHELRQPVSAVSLPLGSRPCGAEYVSGHQLCQCCF